MDKQKVLVCGATGFIGRNIAESFADRDEFELYGTYFESDSWAHPDIEMIQANLTNPKDVDRVVKGMDVIIQAAATTSGAGDIVTKPYYHVTDNAVMNSLILRSAYEHAISHLVFFSCSVMYQSGDVPVKETDFDANEPIHPNYFGVGWTKIYIEKMCEFYSRLGRTRHTVLRHSNIYGPYDKFDLEKSHVFGATMTKVMTAEDRITVWGTGEEERDLLYVSDLVDAVESALTGQENRFELYNIGYGKSIAIRDLVQKIIACSGKGLQIEYDVSKPTIKTTLCLDATKAREQLGWSPAVSLEDGIRKTMDWYQAHFEINE